MAALPAPVRTLSRSAAGRELLASLALLGAICAGAVVSLLAQDNVPKAVRVGAAGSAYLLVVLALVARRVRARPEAAASIHPYRVFAAAGAVAGAVGSLVRPVPLPAPAVLVGIVGMAGLFGGVHWLALRALRRTRGALEAPAPRPGTLAGR
jgi:hypothetical protein